MRKLKNIDIVISGNQSSKAMSYSCLTKFFHKTLSHFFKKIIFINLILLTISCKKEKPTEYDTLAFDIQVEDVSCTEVWLKVKLGENLQPRNITLKRENTTIFTGEILNSDTTFIDENLLPKRSYKYTISKLNELGKEISRDVVATTMDTTSHDFTWQIDTLGDGASSVLYDVAIINDTLAYAVGEIYKRDSVGNWDYNAYNLAQWNGKRWELKRIYTYSSCNPVDYAPLKAIWIFSDSNIWVTSGGSIGRYNGKVNIPDCSIRPLVTGSINKIWASSEKNVYVVGNNGFIAHYDGARWRRLESGTDQTINDVWGVQDPKTNEPFILAGASNVYNPGYIKLLQIKKSGYVDTIPWISQGRRISSVWFQNQNRLFTAGGGVFTRSPNGIWKEFKEIPLIYTNRIRGQAINDIFVVGDFGIVTHWNGINWRLYSEVAVTLYYSCDYKNNMMIAVGSRNRRAFTLIMKKR